MIFILKIAPLCILLSLAAAASASGSGSPATSAPSTEPTSPTTYAADQELHCNFDTLTALVDHLTINRTSFNLSSLVKSCPDVCDLVYGSGNPDISGVGAVISYIFQGITSLIFGPLFAIFVLYVGSNKSSDDWNSYGDPDTLWATKYLLPASRGIYQANAFTAVAVLVAAVIRQSRDLLPVGESRFLATLALYQFLVCLICTVSNFRLYKGSRSETKAMDIYITGCFALLLVAIVYSGSNLPLKVLEKIASGCISVRDSPQTSEDIIIQISDLLKSPLSSEPEIHKAPAADKGVAENVVWMVVMVIVVTLVNVASWILAVAAFGVIFGIFGGLVWLLVKLAKRPFFRLADLLNIGPQRLGALIVIFSVGSASGAFVCWLLADLLRKRDELRALAGDTYEDNDWGFGQITAVMMWAPVIQEVFFAIYRTAEYYKNVKRSREDNTDGAASQELLPRPNPLAVDRWGVRSGITSQLSSRDSDSDSEPHPTPSISTGPRPVPGALQSPSHSTSSQYGPDGTMLQPRTTWPRNESDTYLPL